MMQQFPILVIAFLLCGSAFSQVQWQYVATNPGPITDMLMQADSTLVVARHTGDLYLVRPDGSAVTVENPRDGYRNATLLEHTPGVLFVTNGYAHSYTVQSGKWDTLPLTATGWIAESGDGTLIAASGYGPSHRSFDRGATWDTIRNRVALGLPASAEDDVFAIAAGRDARFYLGYSGSQAMWTTSDGGRSWSPTALWQHPDSIVNGGPIAVTSVGTVVAHGSNGKFATGSDYLGGLYRSSDNGATWSSVLRLQSNAGELYNIMMLRCNSQRCVALMNFDRNRVLESLDDGRTWRELPNDGLLGDTNFMCVALWGETILLGTQNENIYRLDRTATAPRPGVNSPGRWLVTKRGDARAIERRGLVAGTGYVSLHDMLGRCSARRTIDHGLRSLSLPVNSLTPGVYVVAVEEAGRQRESHFVVVDR